MKRVLLGLCLVLMVTGCGSGSKGKSGKALSFKMAAVREYTFCATLNAKGTAILYGFFYLPARQEVVETSDAAVAPAAKGIHWVRTSASGLYVNGKQVDTSSPGVLLAIKPDGTTQPVSVDAPTLNVLTTEGGSWIRGEVNLDSVRAALNEKDYPLAKPELKPRAAE